MTSPLRQPWQGGEGALAPITPVSYVIVYKSDRKVSLHFSNFESFKAVYTQHRGVFHLYPCISYNN